MRYSPSTRGFYPEFLTYANLPADCIEISDAYHAELIAAQNAGMEIVPDADGVPQAVAPTVQIIIPDLVSKLALVKAMREVDLTGQPATPGTSIWDSVKAAIAAAGGDVEEDWQLANYIPRHDPMINALAVQLVPSDPPREQMLDALFLRAAALE